MDASQDPVVQRFRSELTDTDLSIVEAVNRRISLHAELAAYKRDKGYQALDPARERWMLDHLAQANRGPLSPAALADLYRHLLAISKSEVARLTAENSPA
jgi:3-deoxy-7-phosphoheptulonate synthase / chorismate mutase